MVGLVVLIVCRLWIFEVVFRYLNYDQCMVSIRLTRVCFLGQISSLILDVPWVLIYRVYRSQPTTPLIHRKCTGHLTEALIEFHTTLTYL